MKYGIVEKNRYFKKEKPTNAFNLITAQILYNRHTPNPIVIQETKIISKRRFIQY